MVSIKWVHFAASCGEKSGLNRFILHKSRAGNYLEVVTNQALKNTKSLKTFKSVCMMLMKIQFGCRIHFDVNTSEFYPMFNIRKGLRHVRD
jgi:hypothetical protein